MIESELKKSGNFVVYINDYVSSMPHSMISTAAVPNSVAELTANRTIIGLPIFYPEITPPDKNLILGDWSYPNLTHSDEQPLVIDPQLKLEFEAWDALSDEALADNDF